MEDNSSNSHPDENQHMGGSNNSHKENSTEKKIFTNQAEIAWYERREQWVGVPSKKSQRVSGEPIICWTTTYEDLLCSTEPFQQRIPLVEMVEFLVDIWHEGGLDVWAFILTCKVQYCSPYDQGYTSIGSIHDTVPNATLSVSGSSSCKEKFKPAYLLSDGRLERAGRVKKFYPPVTAGNGPDCIYSHKNNLLIAVWDEILFGTVEDELGPSLCGKLHSIGWSVSQATVVRNDLSYRL